MNEQVNIRDIINFYRYFINKKTTSLLIFILITFIFPILPYIIVFISMLNLPEKNQLAFFGDGSIIILCSGILCSFFLQLFDHKSEGEKNLNILINLILIIIFIALILIFRHCQLNFERSWNFVGYISVLTGVILIITFLTALYLNFRFKVNFKDVNDYMEEVRSKKIAKAARKKTKSQGGTAV